MANTIYLQIRFVFSSLLVSLKKITFQIFFFSAYITDLLTTSNDIFPLLRIKENIIFLNSDKFNDLSTNWTTDVFSRRISTNNTKCYTFSQQTRFIYDRYRISRIQNTSIQALFLTQQLQTRSILFLLPPFHPLRHIWKIQIANIATCQILFFSYGFAGSEWNDRYHPLSSPLY